MKVIFYIFAISLLINIHYISFASENLSNTKSINEKNTKLNIKWAKLIEKYLVDLVNNITELKKKYWLENNSEVIGYSERLHKMIIDLNNIQNTDISKNEAEKVMKNIISELKILNVKIKILFKQEKEKREEKEEIIKQNYYNLSNKISTQLFKITKKLKDNINKKSNILQRDEKILVFIKSLEKEWEILKNLEKINIVNNEELRKYILSILKNIKRIISEIKKL